MDSRVASQEGDAEAMAAIRASKKELRRKITNSLSQLSQQSIHEQSHRVAEILLNMLEYKNANRISVYLSMEGKELQTRRIVGDALDSGKKVFVPYIYKNSRGGGSEAAPSSMMDMLALKSHQDYNSLVRDNWGIPSLSRDSVQERENGLGGLGLTREGVGASTPSEALDLIIVPGVAFDERLGRLGHGKGYYDKFLSRCKELFEAGQIKKMPVLIGLALNEQLLPEGEEVPSTATDWRIHGVVTADGTLPR